MAHCRECHNTNVHKLSCSHRRWAGRVYVGPADELYAPPGQRLRELPPDTPPEMEGMESTYAPAPGGAE